MGKQYKQLTVDEREKIAFYKAQRRSVREIAKLVNRHHSSISRELRRNHCPVHRTDYRPWRAQMSARIRKQQSGKRQKLKNPMITRYVLIKLKKGWSPEQIAGRINTDHPQLNISHEAIYQYIYTEKPGLARFLPRRHKRRKKKLLVRNPQKYRIPHRVLIDMRPEAINTRSDFGHWESDSVVSQESRAALHVMVERKSRLVKMNKVDANKAAYIKDSVIKRLSKYRKGCRSSITYDNGSENIKHEEINQELKIKSYFCHPYHSWEKGCVENTNGLIRRFIPKKTDLKWVPKTSIVRIENLLNNRPRKCLNYKTPREEFDALSGALTG